MKKLREYKSAFALMLVFFLFGVGLVIPIFSKRSDFLFPTASAYPPVDVEPYFFDDDIDFGVQADEYVHYLFVLGDFESIYNIDMDNNANIMCALWNKYPVAHSNILLFSEELNEVYGCYLEKTILLSN